MASHLGSRITGRREFLKCLGFSSAALSSGLLTNKAMGIGIGDKQLIVKPTLQQVAWQESELTMFVHFGMNTFTNREWGEGREDPKLFNPTALDAHQWVRTAKESGFRYIILTAKHHDGFCLWPSKYSEHSVKNSHWKNGKGDIVREFANACHSAHMKMGIYLSPWDRHEPSYGDSPAYNRHYINQMTELLTNYGDVAEVWLDGANGEGPNGKKQVYDFDAFQSTIRKLQPNAVIFAPIQMNPDIRWIGNEDGSAGDPCWSTFDTEKFIAVDNTEGWGAKEEAMYQHGHPGGSRWMPGESDVSIRPGWFWHEDQNNQLKTVDHLMDLYFKSVGRNSLLLLNVPPNREGLFSDGDVARLHEFKAARDRAFANDLTQGANATAESTAGNHKPANILDGKPSTYWMPRDASDSYSLKIDLGKEVSFNVALIEEFISEGQCVKDFHLEAATDAGWKEIAKGETIGHRRLQRFDVVTSSKVRITFSNSLATPMIRRFSLYKV